MRPDDQTEYIVQCIRDAASMYEDDARKFLAEHDDHVRTERDAMTVAWLTKKARELRATPKSRQENAADAIDRLASKAARGAVRPDNLRMLPADFFEPDHTYTHTDDGTDWKFRVDAITTHPEDGERTALGWRYFNGRWEEMAYDEDDWEIHLLVGLTDVTEGGEGQ